MAASLALPLDDWVAAAARPVQIDVLNASCESGTRRDYSVIAPEDAFPLLIQACRTRFGSLEALDFNTQESSGPLGTTNALLSKPKIPFYSISILGNFNNHRS